MANLRLSVGEGLDASDLRSLHRWLSQDPDVRRKASLSLQSASEQTGAMGLEAVLVAVVLPDSIAAASLVAAIAQWRASRSKAPAVSIEAVSVNVSVIVSSTDPEELDHAAATLRDALSKKTETGTTR